MFSSMSIENNKKPNAHAPFERPTTIKALLAQVKRPKKAVVTGGMPYANGPLHIGHLAGAHVPPDIYARWLRM
jgi:methionyl-tRNA synthetase